MMSLLDQRLTRMAASVLAIACALPVSAAEEAVPEFPRETAALVDATTALFESIEAAAVPGDRRDVPVISAPIVATPARVEAAPEKVGALTDRGPVKNLTGYRITWYPVDRFLGSVDFMGTWDGNRNLVCGYVTWDLSTPETPVLDQISATYLDVAELAGSSEDEIHAALLDANCAYGAIDANYTLFE